MTKIERNGLLDFYGTDATIVGADIIVGQAAPEFTALANDWSAVKVLESTQGKVRVIGSLPSINTSVCDRETRRFNEEASALSEDIVIIMVSMDLPYSFREWCATAGIERVKTYSDAKNAEFGEAYGVLVKEPRILRRAIFVVDRDNKVVYADYMPALRNEPDYPAALAAARLALGE